MKLNILLWLYPIRNCHRVLPRSIFTMPHGPFLTAEAPFRRQYRKAGKKGEKVPDKILAGIKTMIVRGAAGRKLPHSRVFEGERLYFIEKGSAKITTTAVVKEVQNYVKLSEEEITKTLADNQRKLNLSDKPKTRWHKKCLCLVEFEAVREIPPLAFEHQKNMDDWFIWENIEDVIAGTSIPYNYKVTLSETADKGRAGNSLKSGCSPPVRLPRERVSALFS